MDAALQKRLEKCKSLPTLPALAVRVLALCQKEDLNLSEIAQAIAMDPALSAKVLKVANSPAVGLKRPATTISHAVALLGVNTVRTLALSFSLVSHLRKQDGQAMDHKLYWKRSMLSAIAAQEIARTTRFAHPEEAFLGALLQDVGIMAIVQAGSELYGGIMTRAGGDHGQLAEIEKQELGCDHAEVGQWLLERWKLPKTLSEAVGHSHSVSDFGPDEDLARLGKIVALSGWIADIWTRNDASSAAAIAREKATSIMMLPQADLEDVLKHVAQALAGELAKLFDVDMGSSEDVQAILEQAQETLLEVTMRAEQQAEEARDSVVSLEERNKQLLIESQLDKLTGLPNRGPLDACLTQELQYSQRSTKPVSVLFCDVDFFKKVNDTYGHPAGDIVLVAVSKLLSDGMRQRDLVARYGGEEFIIVLSETNAAGARVVAERVRKKIESTPIDIGGGKTLQVTISIGAATSDPRTKSFFKAELLNAADQGLYAAKRGGRNRCVDYGEMERPSSKVAIK